VEDLGHQSFRPGQLARPHAVTQAHPVTDLETAELLPVLLAAPLMDGLSQLIEMPIQHTVFDERRDTGDELVAGQGICVGRL